ncbi:MAG: FABP family protein [Acidimicrobiia bacterium]|nr:FABP family protein [Acidimicrobiia bacterium]MBV9283874.1 FABP family protein [Acidimicrobiia bacterium]
MGEGKGFYSTISPFEYGEELRVWHVGKPLLAFTQRTWSLDDGRPLHSETGFWRLIDGSHVELVVAHPNGHAEVAEGELRGTSISVASISMTKTSTAKPVDSIERDIRVDGETMSYDLRMAAMGRPLDGHLQAELRLGATH